jgi:hypothetical protein
LLGEFNAVLSNRDIVHISARALNPQANGNAERRVQTVKIHVAAMVDDNPDSWTIRCSECGQHTCTV